MTGHRPLRIRALLVSGPSAFSAALEAELSLDHEVHLLGGERAVSSAVEDSLAARAPGRPARRPARRLRPDRPGADRHRHRHPGVAGGVCRHAPCAGVRYPCRRRRRGLPPGGSGRDALPERPDGQGYDGPSEVILDNPLALVEVGGMFEGHRQVHLGLTAEQPFRVLLLQSPTRLVVDVAHP